MHFNTMRGRYCCSFPGAGSIIRAVLLAFLLSFFMFNFAFAAWYTNSANTTNVWLYKQQIAIKGSSVEATLTNFPVLIKITDPTNPVFSHAQSNGQDILFTASDEVTKLNHQMDYYNSATSTICAWVQVPTLNSTTDTTLYMYYGSSNAASQENRTAVWDSNYIGVHHFSQAAGFDPDSTSFANNQYGGTVDAQALYYGPLGLADRLNGASNSIEVTLSGATIAAGSVTVWASFDADNATRHKAEIFFFNSSANNNRVFMHVMPTSEAFYVSFASIGGGTYPTAINSGFTVPLHQWHAYALTWSGTRCVIYADGNQVQASFDATGLSSVGATALLGFSGGNNEYFTGGIDELRVSKTARSPSWIKTEYRSEMFPSSFFTLSSELERPSVLLLSDLSRYPPSKEAEIPGAEDLVSDRAKYKNSP